MFSYGIRCKYFLVLLVYVNGILLDGYDLTKFDILKDALYYTFFIKSLVGQLKFFFGLEVAHSSQDISIC